VKVKLHKTQHQVANDKHRFKVICAGRRWGKSVLARMMVLKWATEDQGLYWIVSPTYKQAKMIHWREIKKEIPEAWIESLNNSELSVKLKNGSIIELKGAENPDSLRGVKLKGLVIDEIASIRNWKWLWTEVLRATLTDYKAPAIFISTPQGYNHFYDLFEQGKKKDNNYNSWSFTSYQNPHIPEEEIDQAKKELTEDAFHQEYLAEFRKFTGAAFKQWDRKENIIKDFKVPEHWPAFRGFDYGSAHYTASVRIRVFKDKWFVDKCYMDKDRSIREHAEAIQSQDFGLGHVQSWGDPSGAQWFTEFAQHNLHIQPANKETGQAKKGWVQYCVEKINQRLKKDIGSEVLLPNHKQLKNKPRLLVLDRPCNEPFIRQIEQLKWRKISSTDTIVPSLDETDDPTGGHYDLMAALRYLAASWKPKMDKKEAEKVMAEFPEVHIP
jgi:hypothetical protein